MTGLGTAGAIGSIVTALATTAALIVLIWYTVETHKLRLEAQRQNEHSMMPVVAFQTGYFPPHTKSSSLVVSNLGSGPAFNIRISSIQLSGRAAVFEHPFVLAPGQHEFVALSGLREPKVDQAGGYDDGKIHAAYDLLKALKSASDILETKFVITCTSTSGKNYRSKFTLGHKSDDVESFVRFDGIETL
ncbi:MAG: hypothetical protein WCB12_05065 [Bryobacteraceae bacterium]